MGEASPPTTPNTPDPLQLKTCGVKFDPPAIVITYLVTDTGKLHRRTMPLRSFSKHSSVERAVESLQANPRHQKFVHR
jgi:centrosomal protein CEP19